MFHKASAIATMVLGTALSAVLGGCATSATEEQFGNAVRDTLAQQRIAPEPAEDAVLSGDGARTENVINVYRSNMGDPGQVVGARKVSKE